MFRIRTAGRIQAFYKVERFLLLSLSSSLPLCLFNRRLVFESMWCNSCCPFVRSLPLRRSLGPATKHIQREVWGACAATRTSRQSRSKPKNTKSAVVGTRKKGLDVSLAAKPRLFWRSQPFGLRLKFAGLGFKFWCWGCRTFMPVFDSLMLICCA